MTGKHWWYLRHRNGQMLQIRAPHLPSPRKLVVKQLSAYRSPPSLESELSSYQRLCLERSENLTVTLRPCPPFSNQALPYLYRGYSLSRMGGEFGREENLRLETPLNYPHHGGNLFSVSHLPVMKRITMWGFILSFISGLIFGRYQMNQNVFQIIHAFIDWNKRTRRCSQAT